MHTVQMAEFGCTGNFRLSQVAPTSRERMTVPMRPGVESPSVRNSVRGSPRVAARTAGMGQGEDLAAPRRLPRLAVVRAAPDVVVDHGEDGLGRALDHQDVVNVLVRDLAVHLRPPVAALP